MVQSSGTDRYCLDTVLNLGVLFGRKDSFCFCDAVWGRPKHKKERKWTKYTYTYNSHPSKQPLQVMKGVKRDRHSFRNSHTAINRFRRATFALYDSIPSFWTKRA